MQRKEQRVAAGGDIWCKHGGVLPGACGGGDLQKVSIERKSLRMRVR